MAVGVKQPQGGQGDGAGIAGIADIAGGPADAAMFDGARGLQSDPASVEQVETGLLLEGIYQVHGADLRGHARGPLMQRLQRFMQQEGVATISALQDRILHARPAAEALVQALFLRPASLFGDTGRLAALRAAMVPYLRSCPLPKIWIAESTCSEDVFALVILLIEEGLYDKTLIFVTAADDRLLARARFGQFPLHRLGEYESNYLRCGGTATLVDYCRERHGQMEFLPHCRPNLIWAKYDLATDRSFNEFQLIVCQRVLPEFGVPLQRRALRLFADSLSPFGLLCVDGPQAMTGTAAAQFQAVDPAQGLFRRTV